MSLLWIVYNMIPPYLLIHYTFIGRGSTLNFMSKCAPNLVARSIAALACSTCIACVRPGSRIFPVV